MRKIIVKVNPGVCGFKTVIEASSENKRQALLDIKTDCPNLKPLESELKTADAYKEVFAKFGKSGVFETTAKYCKHSACPVPTAILKGIEACCGLALPRDVVIEIRAENQD
jgi:hypothetical protein